MNYRDLDCNKKRDLLVKVYQLENLSEILENYSTSEYEKLVEKSTDDAIDCVYHMRNIEVDEAVKALDDKTPIYEVKERQWF